MALREILADLRVRVRGGEQLQRANRGVQSTVGSLRQAGRALGAAGAALSSALAVRPIAAATAEVIQFGDEVAKTARILGIGADELNRWRFAAERSGVDANQLTGGLQRLQRNIVDAGEGVQTAVRAFRDVGVSATDSEGRFREIEDLLPELADGFAGLESDTQRAARAQQLFGRSGTALLPFFENGAAGIRELTARFDELGGNLGGEFFENSEAAQDALSDFDLVSRSLRTRFVAQFLPTITRVVTAIAEFAATVERTLSRSSAMQTALGVLAVAAGVLAVALAPVILSFVGMALPIVAVILLIEDLVTMFRGGESAIGDFIDATFGVGTAQEWVENLTAAWDGLTLAIRRGLAALRGEELPTASGRAAPTTAAAAGDRQRNAAALEGRVVGSRGQSFEEALAAANATREGAGLPPIGGGPSIPAAVAAEAGTERRRVGRGVSAARGGGGTVTQTVTAPVTVNVEGAGDPEAVGAAAARRTEQALGRIFSNAAATLPQGAGA